MGNTRKKSLKTPFRAGAILSDFLKREKYIGQLNISTSEAIQQTK